VTPGRTVFRLVPERWGWVYRFKGKIKKIFPLRWRTKFAIANVISKSDCDTILFCLAQDES
jgi:hypothetical protein